MWRFSDIMVKYAERVGDLEGSRTYTKNAEIILRVIEEKCRFDHYGLYADYLDLQPKPNISPSTGLLIESQSEELVPSHSTHLGLVNLFPLLLGVPVQHPEATLSLLADPKHLLSPYGPRTLSLADPLYRKGSNYWRGAIWINVTYLILKELKQLPNELQITETSNFSPEPKTVGELYKTLRANVIEVVFSEWKRTGLFWE